MRTKSDPLLGALYTITSPLIASLFVLSYISLILSLIVIVVVSFIILYLYIKFRIFKSGASNKNKNEDQRVIAFFHPYCDAGGGGERVLWCGVRAIQKKYPAEKLVIFTGDVDSAPDQIVARAKQRFDIDLSSNINGISRECQNLKLF